MKKVIKYEKWLLKNRATTPKRTRDPPVRISWRSRGDKETVRWIFLRCCGGIAFRDQTSGLLETRGCCGRSVPEGARHHPGPLRMMRTTVTQGRKGGEEIARWDCCGAVAVPHWDTI